MANRFKSSGVGALILICALLPVLAQDEDALLGLPVLAYPDDNPYSPQKIALGRQLFFDKRLSADNSISCASCHRPERLFSDGLERAEGIRQQAGTRNTPSLVNAAFNTTQFWDGRRSTLEAQAGDPLVNPREHGLPNDAAVIGRVREVSAYEKAFFSAYKIKPSAIEMRHLAEALAAFERTLIAGNSPFDRYYFNDEKAALSASAQRGLALFQGRAQCASCHTIESAHALFTDNKFHSLSIGINRINPRLATLTTNLARQQEYGGNRNSVIMDDRDIAELGRFAVTLEPVDIGKFRTPNLRNVALTAPYMHDGSISTLADTVEYELYYRSGERGYPLILTPIEKQDLVAFLKSLTSNPTSRARITSSQ